MAGEDVEEEKEGRLLSRLRTMLLRNGLAPQSVRLFQQIIYKPYYSHPRILPWRKTRNPYRILVSEIMLQQTQVERVLGKYGPFIRRFPDFSSLAAAPLSEVLQLWQGLGYNRRAIALQTICRAVMDEYHGRLPASKEELLRLPGIGHYTASAILTFTRNHPNVFIETNIRRVFIHFFFPDKDQVADAELMPIIEKTLDTSNPREWYYALMDYGVALKKTQENPNKRSAHYRRQAPFHGSSRQLRGAILRALLREPGMSKAELSAKLNMDPLKITDNLSVLVKEGFLKKKGARFSIA